MVKKGIQLSYPRGLLQVLILAAAGCQVAMAADNPVDVEDYLGRWCIVSFEGDSLGLTPEYARSQLGLCMELEESSASFETGLLWFGEVDCGEAAYRWLEPFDFIGHLHQALLPHDHPELHPEQPLFLDVSCSGEGVTGFEVTNANRLVAYYASVWFFFEPGSSQEKLP